MEATALTVALVISRDRGCLMTGRMRTSDERLAEAERHVQAAEADVTGQEELLEKLWRNGQPTVIAEALLHAFEQTLASQREELERLRAELGLR